jgi:O-antigen/teichoic acid export membrane protein
LPDFSSALKRLARTDLVRYGAVVFAAQTAVNVFSFIFHVVVSRRVGVVLYGELNALLAGFAILSVPATILTTVVVKYAAEFRALDDAPRLRALVLRIGFGLGGIALLLVPLGVLAAPVVGGYLHVAAAGVVVLGVVMLALNLVLPVLRGVLQGVEHFTAYAISAALEAVVKVALALAFTALGWGVAGALGAWALGSAVSLAYTFGVLYARYGGQPHSSLRIDYARLGRTSAKVALATLLIAAMGFGDVVIVKHYFDPQTAGLYGAAALSGKMLFWLVAFVPAVVLPRAAGLAGRGERASSILVPAFGAIALLAGGGLLAYAFFPATIVTTLAGGAFVSAAPLVFPYGVAATLLAMLNTIVFFKVGLHRFDFLVPLTLVVLAELVAVILRHATPQQVIEILIAGNSVALLASLYRINAVRVSAAPTSASSARRA